MSLFSFVCSSSGGITVSVNVVADLKESSGVDPGGPIHDVNGNGGLEGNVLFDFTMHGGFDHFRSPFGLVFKEIHGQFRRVFDANTSVAEVAADPVEQVVRGRVVNIDIELVRKKKLHKPQ